MNIVKQKLEKLKLRLTRGYYKKQVRHELVLAPRECPYCETETENDILYTRDRYDFHINTVRCKSCGLVMVNPAPTEEFLKHFYSSKQYRGLYLGLTNTDTRYGKENREKAVLNASFIEKHVALPANASVIDIGSACGDFLLLLKEKHPDYRIFGVEPDMNFSEKEKNSFSGFFPSVEEIPEQQTFDLITMWHVLEHIFNPVTFLEKLRGLLSPQGVLVIEIPNLSKYNHIKSIHFAHLFHFDAETITKVAKKAGFEKVEISEDNLTDTLTGMRVVLRPH